MKKLFLLLPLLLCTACFAQQLINPKDYGAKGDGIADDLPALNRATADAIAKGITEIHLDNGVYRITDSWVIGSKGIAEKDFGYTGTLTKAPSFNRDNYMVSRHALPVKITGSGDTRIYADFVSDKLKTAIYFSVPVERINDRQSELYASEISNIGIYAKGAFTGKSSNTNKPYAENNQAGIFAFWASGIRVTDVTVYGFKQGIILNNSYFSNLTNVHIISCDTGFQTIQSHGSVINNMRCYTSNTAYVISSGQVLANGMSTEHCKVAMRLRGSNNVFNECYFENIYNAGQGQLLVGDNGEPADRNCFNGITIGCNAPNGDCIVMGKNAKRLSLNMVNITGAITFTNRAVNELIVQNSTYMNDPNIFVIGKNIAAANGIFSGGISLPKLKAPAGTKKQLFVDDKGNITTE